MAAESQEFDCHSVMVPSAHDMFKGIDQVSWVLLSVATAFAVVICILFGVQIFHIFTYVSSYTRAGRLAWLSGLFPVTAVACLIAACVPRAAAMTDVLILLYFARCLFSFVDLLIDYFGGRLEMSQELAGTELHLASPPCCCCCRCLPAVKLSVNIRRLEMMVYQVAIVRPILYFIDGVVWVDSLGVVGSKKTPSPYVTVINVVSTLTSMYGTHLFTKLSEPRLNRFCVKPLFRLIQIMILLFNLQQNIFNILATMFNVIECTALLPAITRSLFWSHLLLIAESCIISLVATVLLKPSVNATFDLHKHQTSKELDSESGNVALHSAGPSGNRSVFNADGSHIHDFDDFSDVEEEPRSITTAATHTHEPPKLAFSL